MNVYYKWTLEYGETIAEVHPIYKDDLALDYQQEQGQMFFRGKLSSKITFVGADADRIINAPFYTEFIILISKRTDIQVGWTAYYYCHFYKTDCTINEDDRSVSVQPLVMDDYNDILNGMEKEYNLLELPIAIQPIKAKKRPMLQIYADGEDIVTCITAGNSFETDRINDSIAPSDCHFALSNESWRIDIQNTQIVGLTAPFTGIFRGKEQTEPFDKFYSSELVYYIQYFERYVWSPTGGSYYNGLRIKSLTTNETIWEFEQMRSGSYLDIPNNITFTSLVDGTTLTAEKSVKTIYARFVCDVTEVTEPDTTVKQTYPIPSDDIVADNRNYRYCIGTVVSRIYQSDRKSNTPTKWGRTDDGKYFLPPDDYLPYIPVARSQWGNTSLWVEISTFMNYYDEHASKEYTIKDTYPIASVINALLSKVAPNIIFNENATSSKFFYDDTMVSGVASVLNGSRPFISPKSNILLGEYQEPAQKAPITLKKVFDMIKKVYGCYWYIKADKTLVIEHISWFKNGGSYSGTPAIGYDLTTLENLPNGKKWAFGTSTYQFDKVDMPARYQFEWMDEVSDLFKGQPINVLSKFVTENKVEEINIAEFSSDIDLMLLAAEKFSKDGFALLQAEADSGEYILPSNTYADGVYNYTIQNYMVSMRFLQPNFLTYDMPSWNIELNGTATTAAGIQRLKKQTLTFPSGVNDPDLNTLVKTYIGNGQYDKVNVNLSSRAIKVTLKYNTYDN